MNVAIIGAGASGVMTALSIKENNKNINVDLYEKEDRILKKLAATGGGRCNLGNLNIKPEYFNDGEFIKNFMSYNTSSYLEYFNKYNLKLVSDGNLLYPYSKTASMVINFFKQRLKDTNVNVYCNSNIEQINFKEKKFNNKKYDFIVISIGSKALNCDNKIYNLVNKDFKITNLQQSLVGFKSNQIKDMKEIRQVSKVTLFRKDKVILEQFGEVQFKQDGISGICVMNLSSKYKDNDHIEIDFFPNDSLEEIKSNIINRGLTTKNCFKFTLENKIINLIKIQEDSIDNLSESQLENFINKYKKFTLKVDGLYDYKFSQVVKGGVSLDEVKGFESKKYKQIFFTGEILDIDALCGGYNLWFAFNSGMKVGEDICKYVLEK